MQRIQEKMLVLQVVVPYLCYLMKGTKQDQYRQTLYLSTIIGYQKRTNTITASIKRAEDDQSKSGEVTNT